MPNWHSQQWLTAPPKFAPGAAGDGPAYAMLSPLPDSTHIPARTSIRAVAYTESGSYNVTLRINDVVAYTSYAFTQGFAGFSRVVFGRLFIEAAPRTPFPPGKTVRVALSVEDTDTMTTTSAFWSYTTISDARYTGSELLPEESWVLAPCERFLAVEPFRLWLLENVLAEDLGDAVAARAIYQHAYATEISAALNPFMTPNDAALQTVLPARASTLTLAQGLESYEAAYDAALAQLFSSGAFPREYRNNFADYFESLLYSYRVSAVCALVFLARAIEIASTTPTNAADNLTLLTEDDYVFLLEDGYELEL